MTHCLCIRSAAWGFCLNHIKNRHILWMNHKIRRFVWIAFTYFFNCCFRCTFFLLLCRCLPLAYKRRNIFNSHRYLLEYGVFSVRGINHKTTHLFVLGRELPFCRQGIPFLSTRYRSKMYYIFPPATLEVGKFLAYIWLNSFLPACLRSAGYPVHPYAFSVRQISSGNASISFPFSKRIVYIISIHSSRMRGDMRDCTSTPPCRFYTLPSYEGGDRNFPMHSSFYTLPSYVDIFTSFHSGNNMSTSFHVLFTQAPFVYDAIASPGKIVPLNWIFPLGSTFTRVILNSLFSLSSLY